MRRCNRRVAEDGAAPIRCEVVRELAQRGAIAAGARDRVGERGEYGIDQRLNLRDHTLERGAIEFFLAAETNVSSIKYHFGGSRELARGDGVEAALSEAFDRRVDQGRARAHRSTIRSGSRSPARR